MRRLHHLETPLARWINPTRVIHEILRQHSAAPLEALADGFRIAVFKVLDDHEQHERSVAPRFELRPVRRAAILPP